MKLRFSVAALLLIVVLEAHAIERCPDSVRITFFDHAVPPFFNGSGDGFSDPPGFFVDWNLKAVNQTGCTTRVLLSRRPVKRAYVELERDETDIVAVTNLTTEHPVKFAYPEYKGELDTRQTYYVNTTSLWVRKGEDTVHWDGKTLIGPPGFTVGAPRGTTFETIARAHGWNVELGVNGPSTVKKLLIGRVPVTLVPDAAVNAQPIDKVALLERLQPSLEQTAYFSIDSNTFYAPYTEFMNRYWKDL